ncbi:hypothetical protein FQR65_LT08031 [Abscondita terminalis]|nr:hypothetical protein FQR65_LT08031 [Abscondita terminalis]
MIIICLVALVFSSRTACGDVCTKPACRKASSDILSFIDPSVDPCQDFYKFTCGSLFKKTFDTKPASLEALVTKEVEDQTTKMLQKPSFHSEPKAFQALKRFFRACLDEVAIEKEGIDTIKRTLSRLGGWPILEGGQWNDKNFSLEDLLIKLREEGYDYMQLFYFGTTVGEDDKTLLIGEPIIKNIEPDYVDSYFEFMQKVSTLLGVDSNAEGSELNDILNFKLSLLHVVEKSGPFKKTTIASIQNEFPIINWSNFVKKLVHPNKEPSANQIMYFPSVEYLQELSGLLKQTSNRTLANYIIWKAIESALPFLPHEFNDLKEKYPQAFYDIANGVKKSRLAFCKNEAKKIFPPTYEMLYISEYFSREKRQSIKDLVSVIHMELISLLNETELYDESTRRIMLEKAKAITYHFGAPERLFEEGLADKLFLTDENFDTNNFLTLAAMLTRQKNNFKFNLDVSVNRYDNYYEETTLVHSFYETYRNAFVIPAASLQGLYFNEERPQYMNFGTIGTIAGIELIRGFTESGSKFDKDGNRAETWTKNTEKVFNKKADCLVREASFFEIEDSVLRMDGRLILEKTTCDYTGVEIAYRAYNTWMKIYGQEDELPGLNYSPRQLFWISTASSFCDTVSLDNLKRFIIEEHQVHPTFRVFGSLTNNEHFGKDFNCTVESPMNPAIKCKVF